MNTFGSSILQFALCDARSVIKDRVRFRRDSLDSLERANSFYCPVGRWSFRGWVLLPRYEYDKLDKYSTALQLNIGNTTSPDNVGTLKNLSIVQARCVTRGLVTDPNALYLVELTDPRGILSNEWFQFPATTQYNIRVPAYPQTFHPSSMNSGTTWTWTTMVQNLWQSMPLLGTWPGLPNVPSSTPEGFWFPGVSAWEALCEVLDHLGMAVACNLTSANPYTIIDVGATDATFTAIQTRWATNLEDDLEYIDTGAGRVPKTVVVLFKRRNATYGTEETVRYDSLQWDMTPYYSLSISPAAYASATGTHYLWSDFTVRYDQDGSPLAADMATATTIATDRVTQYYDRITGVMDQTYAGALPFVTGSMVGGICWKQDNRERSGWRTHIVRGPNPPWAGIWDK